MSRNGTIICGEIETVAIQWEFAIRGITRLCHLTTLGNLFSILEDKRGILARDFIPTNRLRVNDTERLDGRTEYISTTVEYPNVWYYSYKKRTSLQREDWAVIFVNPVICREDNSLFCPVNAATGRGNRLRTGAAALRSLFDDVVPDAKGGPRTPNRLRCCPTCDQAEVMIYRQIPRRYFIGMAFESRDVMELFISRAREKNLRYPVMYIAPGLFTTDLSRMIREGKAPMEFKVKEAA